MRTTTAIAITVLLAASPLRAETRRIGAINFYGYTGLDLQQVRSALPLHEDDPLPSKEQLTLAQKTYAAALGRDRVKLTPNCCLADGRLLLFVGIAEPNAPALLFNPKPTGEVRLPVEVMTRYQEHTREVANAVMQRQNTEDDSKGYRLLAYPPARAIELQIRSYAVAHADELIKVVTESADATHRAAAAEALGYADESPEQVAALVQASFDPNADVRDDANRAVSILLDHDPKIVLQLPIHQYVALLHSIDWLDRNKAASIVETLTATRAPELMRTLRTEAVGPLREIVRWKDFSHALAAFEALGRIAGLDEAHIMTLAQKEDVDSLLREVDAKLASSSQ